MIENTLNLLKMKGMIDRADIGSCNIILARKTTVQVFDRHRRYMVKIFGKNESTSEFDFQREAHELLQRYVAEPLLRVTEGPYTYCIYRYLSHSTLSFNDLVSNGNKKICTDLMRYFDSMDKNALIRDHSFNSPENIQAINAAVCRIAPELRLENAVCERIAELLSSLPAVKQHGDFTFNNLSKGGEGLIIFDWEDFGRVNYPGYDLATLIFSSFKFDFQEIKYFFEGKIDCNLGKIMRHFNNIYNINSYDFFTLFRYYLYVFLYMKIKYNYGEYIKDRVLDLLRQMRS